jgi:DMSO reductase anchor subunit
LRNLATSWLSREILAIGIFSFCLVVVLGTSITTGDSRLPAILLAPAAAAGVFLLWTMARVYLIPTIPAWNSAYTPLSFIATAVCLGLVSCLLFNLNGVFELEKQAMNLCVGLLVAVLILELLFGLLHQRRQVNMDVGFDGPAFDHGALYTLFLARMAALLVACLAVIFLVLQPGYEHHPWLYPVLVLVILQEFAGRLLFYASYFRTGL